MEDPSTGPFGEAQDRLRAGAGVEGECRGRGLRAFEYNTRAKGGQVASCEARLGLRRLHCGKVAEAEDGGTIEVWGDGTAIRSYTYVSDMVDGTRINTDRMDVHR